MLLRSGKQLSKMSRRNQPLPYSNASNSGEQLVVTSVGSSGILTSLEESPAIKSQIVTSTIPQIMMVSLPQT